MNRFSKRKLSLFTVHFYPIYKRGKNLKKDVRRSLSWVRVFPVRVLLVRVLLVQSSPVQSTKYSMPSARKPKHETIITHGAQPRRIVNDLRLISLETNLAYYKTEFVLSALQKDRTDD